MISEYQKNGKKAWMFNEYIGLDRTTGVQKYATKRGFRSGEKTRTTLNRMRSDFEREGLQASNRVKFKDVYDIWMEEHRRMVKQRNGRDYETVCPAASCRSSGINTCRASICWTAKEPSMSGPNISHRLNTRKALHNKFSTTLYCWGI